MSYGASAALQAAVFRQLQGDAALGALVGANVFDAAPPGAVPELYVSLGAEEVRDRSDKSGPGAVHLLVVSVVTGLAGFRAAKEAAVAVCDALQDAPLVLVRGRLVSLRFDRARARRERDGQTRRIDLRFVARVEDD